MQVKVNPAAVYAELDDGAVVLNVDTGIYFGLDRVGSRIWALVGDGSTAASIVDQLEREYAAERTRLETDVAGYLRLLEEKGLVKVALA